MRFFVGVPTEWQSENRLKKNQQNIFCHSEAAAVAEKSSFDFERDVEKFLHRSKRKGS